MLADNQLRINSNFLITTNSNRFIRFQDYHNRGSPTTVVYSLKNSSFFQFNKFRLPDQLKHKVSGEVDESEGLHPI